MQISISAYTASSLKGTQVKLQNDTKMPEYRAPQKFAPSGFAEKTPVSPGDFPFPHRPESRAELYFPTGTSGLRPENL